MKSREPFCTKTHYKRMRISRNVLFVVVDDDDNDKYVDETKKGASVTMEGAPGTRERKIRNSEKKINLVFSRTTYATTRFRLAYVGSVR